jgi:hypothetical protein
MAGASSTPTRGPRVLASAAVLTGLLATLFALMAPAAPAKPSGGIKADENCPALPAGLSPDGGGPGRFTMLIRINQQVNANTWNSFDESAGGLGGRVRPQDIFVINTRFDESDAAVAYQIATSLRQAHPCNRIIALNGMGFEPTRAGYAFMLLDHPSVYALMTDFEPMDWVDSSAPGRPPWSYDFGTAFPRIKQWNGRLAGALAKSAQGSGKRSGLVPLDISGWNYGQIAQNLDKRNKRLGNRHIGPLSVQTQDACANGGASTFAARAKGIFEQYRYKFITKRVKVKGKKKKKTITIRRKLKKKARPDLSNLSLQISFSNTPNPNSSMAITKTSAKTAAACTRRALKAGAGAIFYFASPDSMRLLFQQPEIGSLRKLKAKK